MKNLWICLIVVLSACASGEVAGDQEFADLILINCNLITMEENVSGDAIAIKADTIFDMGTTEAIKLLAGPSTRIINLDGATVLPGFIEGHGHLLGLGDLQRNIDLTQTKSYEEIVAMVAEAVKNAAPGEWIIGRGWHQEKWDSELDKHVQGYPYHYALSAVSPDNPVILNHASGHAILANKKAMDLAGISNSSKDPAGGKIIRNKEGIAIGVFEENAELLVKDLYEQEMAALSDEKQYQNWKKSILAATREAQSKGITSFTDAGVSFKEIKYYQRLKEENELQLRMYIMIYSDLQKLQQENWKPLIDTTENLLTVRAIKKYMDGALGSRGAWLLEPYADDPDNVGQNVTPLAELDATAKIAAENGLQLCIHAIGDRANREVLDLYQKTFQRYGNSERRWRIEHAQHIHPDDVPRFASLNVIPSMQAIHCISDAPFVEKRLGKARAESGAYVWRDLINAGATIANGTDTPVEKVDPLLNYYAAVTRKALLTDDSFYPAQAMSREEALRSLTINNAYAAFEENKKGSLKTGKLADIVVLEKDITKIPAEEIRNVKVLYTILGGQIVFEQ